MPLLVLCLGNDLLGDDAAALEAASVLREHLKGFATIATSSAAGLYLLEDLEGFEDVIVVDTYPGPSPGRVRELRWEEMRPMAVASAHSMGLPEALEVGRQAGLHLPHRMRIFVVEIARAQWVGAPPSSEVRKAVPELVRMVVEAAKEWGYG